jgi:hypothetical protein
MTTTEILAQVDALRDPEVRVDAGLLPDVADSLHRAALVIEPDSASAWRQAFERLAVAVYRHDL